MRYKVVRAHLVAGVVGAVAGCSLNYDLGRSGDGPGDAGPSDVGAISDEGGTIADAGVPDAGPAAEDAAVPIVLVQKQPLYQETKVSAAIVTLPSATRAGDLVVVVYGGETNSSIAVSSISDNASNVYQLAQQPSVDDSDNDRVEIWYAANVKPGATSVTVNTGPISRAVIWVAEFAGLSKTNPFDKGGRLDNQASSQLVVAPKITPSSPSALVISGGMTSDDISAVFPGNNFTSLGPLDGDDAAYFIAHDNSAAYGATWATKGNGTWNASSVVFKP